MTQRTISEPVSGLERVRSELMTAVVRDRSRAARRRKAGLVAIAAVVAVGAVGSAIAAATGAFTPAPPEVKQTFADLNGDVNGPGVEASKAVEIGVIDEHTAYAAPTASGGFCIYYAPNPRSGPSGSACTSDEPAADGIVFDVSVGTDGGFIFGRVGDGRATTVQVELPVGGGTLTTPVKDERFFLLELPERALASLRVDGERGVFSIERIRAVSAVAEDAQGTTVARASRPTGPAATGLDQPTVTGPDPGTAPAKP